MCRIDILYLAEAIPIPDSSVAFFEISSGTFFIQAVYSDFLRIDRVGEGCAIEVIGEDIEFAIAKRTIQVVKFCKGFLFAVCIYIGGRTVNKSVECFIGCVCSLLVLRIRAKIRF